MSSLYTTLFQKVYSAFNIRDIDAALTTMHPNIEWPRAFEGGYISGHQEIRAYWTRQWAEINPTVKIEDISERTPHIVEITVHQVVRDLQDNCLFDGMVKHVYELQDGLLRRMNIEVPEYLGNLLP